MGEGVGVAGSRLEGTGRGVRGMVRKWPVVEGVGGGGCGWGREQIGRNR